MSEYDIEVTGSEDLMEAGPPDWRPKVYIAFAVVGVLVGLGTAYLFIQNVDDDEQGPELTAGKGIKIGLLLLGLVRNVADLAS